MAISLYPRPIVGDFWAFTTARPCKASRIAPIAESKPRQSSGSLHPVA